MEDISSVSETKAAGGIKRKDLKELLKEAAAAKLTDADADSSVGGSVVEDEQEGEGKKGNWKMF